MMASIRPLKVIIDTDPGVDDVLALLFALSASTELIEVPLISVTYGNVEVQNCLRNVVSMFHVIEKEMHWRKENGQKPGFEMLRHRKPLVAVGAEKPLGKQKMAADYFHGKDGLGGVHTSHPHHSSPEETWKHLFDKPPGDTILTTTAITAAHTDPSKPNPLFTPSNNPSHLEILRILQEEQVGTVSIVAIGPLTNLALAASVAPDIFMRARNVVVMGGAVSVPGNITPVGEFNILADPMAAARVFALTSPNPASTMPPPFLADSNPDGDELPPYPRKEDLGDRRLNLILLPLDLTTDHYIRRDDWEAKVQPLAEKGSPLAEWTSAFVGATLNKMEILHHGHEGGSTSMSLHDPACVWFVLSYDSMRFDLTRDEDIRIETAGQWTRGMCVIDRRDRKMTSYDYEEGVEVSGDKGGWLSSFRGNRINRCTRTAGEILLSPMMLDYIFA